MLLSFNLRQYRNFRMKNPDRTHVPTTWTNYTTAAGITEGECF